MPWFKVDDGLWGHPKWRRVPHRARSLWVTAGAWSADQLTDGFIPTHILPALDGATRDARELVDAGLWQAVEGGFQFWQWLERQPSREAVLAERAAATERQRIARERRKSQRESQRDIDGSHGVSHGLVTEPRPDPTRPDHLLTTSEGESHLTLAASSAAPSATPRCATHSKLPDWQDPGPCVGCQRTRQSTEKARAAAAVAAIEARIKCERCLGSGLLEDPETREPIGKCDHRRTS
jgi:hypothetical protein